MNLAHSAALVEHAVREAVGALAAPEVRDEVVNLALAKARLFELPQRGAEVATFIEGPLHLAALELLGQEAADAIGLELAPIARMMMADEVSEVRPKTPVLGVELPLLEEDEFGIELPPIAQNESEDFPQLTIESNRSSPPHAWAASRPSAAAVTDDAAPAAPWTRPAVPSPAVPQSGARRSVTDPAPDHLPLVLVASSDPATMQELGRSLNGTATVDPIRDALAIMEMLESVPTRLVVVDCQHSTIRIETLIALAPELPSQSRIVLWREQVVLPASLAALGAELPTGWVCCGAGANADDVAAVCSVLLA